MENLAWAMPFLNLKGMKSGKEKENKRLNFK